MDQETVSSQFRATRDGNMTPQESYTLRTAGCVESRIPKNGTLRDFIPYLRAGVLTDILRRAASSSERYAMLEVWIEMKDRGGDPSSWDHPAYQQLHLTLNQFDLAPICLQYGGSGLARVLVPLYCPDELDRVRADELRWDGDRWLKFFLLRRHKEQLEAQMALELANIGKLVQSG